MKRSCLVLLILLLSPCSPFQPTLIESQADASGMREELEAFLKAEQLGTLDVETGTWWLELPSTEPSTDDKHDAIRRTLELYEQFAEMKELSASELSLKTGINIVAYKDGDWVFRHVFERPNPQEEFQAFLMRKQLGTFDVDTGTWWFGPSEARLDQEEVVNLAYGLEWYKIYAEDRGQSPQQLREEIGLNGFVYGDLKIETGVFLDYFDLDVYRQSEILLTILGEKPSG